VVVLLVQAVLLVVLGLAPVWLRTIAAANPLSHAVDAARALFNEQLSDPSIPRALVILGVAAAIALVTASRAFTRSAA
jgi:ABC-2 type transport system permease protein